MIIFLPLFVYVCDFVIFLRLVCWLLFPFFDSVLRKNGANGK